jgi:hypothetical protein
LIGKKEDTPVSRKNSKLIQKTVDGVIYNPVDIGEGEFTPQELADRATAREAAYTKQYQTNDMCGLKKGSVSPSSVDVTPGYRPGYNTFTINGT